LVEGVASGLIRPLEDDREVLDAVSVQVPRGCLQGLPPLGHERLDRSDLIGRWSGGLPCN
jgi:hypothetical protein